MNLENYYIHVTSICFFHTFFLRRVREAERESIFKFYLFILVFGNFSKVLLINE